VLGWIDTAVTQRPAASGREFNIQSVAARASTTALQHVGSAAAAAASCTCCFRRRQDRVSVRLSVCPSVGSARMLAPPSVASRKPERAAGQVGTQARHLGVLEPGGVNEPPNDCKMSFFVQLRKLKTANQL